MSRPVKAIFYSLLSLLFFVPEGAGGQLPEFRYRADPETLLLDYQLRPGLIYYGEPHLGLQLFGNGKIIATLPEKFPRNAIQRRGYIVSRRGSFETRLTPQETEELLRDVEPAFSIDPPALKAAKRNLQADKGRTDGAFTQLRIRLDDYRPAQGNWQGPLEVSIDWKDVYGDARLYPSVEGIQNLHRADKALSQWVFEIAARVDAEERQP